MAIGDADLDVFLADFGVDVNYQGGTINGVFPKGILKTTDQGNPPPGVDNSNLGRFVELIMNNVPAWEFQPESQITVDGTVYQLVTWDKIEDGKYSRLWLQAL